MRMVCAPALDVTLSKPFATPTGPVSVPPLKFIVPVCQVNRADAPLALIEPPVWLKVVPDTVTLTPFAVIVPLLLKVVPDRARATFEVIEPLLSRLPLMFRGPPVPRLT